jgi:hypothetical protein
MSPSLNSANGSRGWETQKFCILSQRSGRYPKSLAGDLTIAAALRFRFRAWIAVADDEGDKLCRSGALFQHVVENKRQVAFFLGWTY